MISSWSAPVQDEAIITTNVADFANVTLVCNTRFVKPGNRVAALKDAP